MAALRQEQEESATKCEELQSKVKTLQQENLAKEQEIKSLSHNNQRLEGVVEKLEEDVQKHKDLVKEHSEHSNQNESLQRRLQLLEEEAEEADKNMRETNEKYVALCFASATSVSPGMRLRLTDSLLQATSNRCQSWPLRAKSAGSGSGSRSMGREIRGDVQEVQDGPDRIARLPSGYRQHVGCGTGSQTCGTSDGTLSPQPLEAAGLLIQKLGANDTLSA